MKSSPIIFITFNSINKYLSHASQMHIHTYKWRVQDLEPYSGIQGWHKHLWTLVDPNIYMRCVDIFPYYSLSFSSLISFQKSLSSPISSTIIWQTFPIITVSCITSPPYILLFTPHSPVICKDNFPLVYMYKSSRYYTVFHIDWVLCSLGQHLSKSWNRLHCSLQVLWLILPVTSWSYH